MEQRKILFKAKCIADGEWAKGYYYKKPSYKKISNGDIVEDGEVYCIYGMTKDDVHPYWYEVDPSTVCQFTGLKDREGNDIYEYDILQDIESKYKRMVLWGKETCGFVFARPNGAATTKPFRSCHVKFTRVVGNRFDRKEEK